MKKIIFMFSTVMATCLMYYVFLNVTTGNYALAAFELTISIFNYSNALNYFTNGR